MSKTETVDDRCPICRRHAAGQMHTDALVRALGVRLCWDAAEKPLAVCAICYRMLAYYRQIALQDAKEADPAAATAALVRS